MKRFLTSTTAISLALMPLQPMPAMAQVLDKEGRIVAADGTVLCEPSTEVVCDLLDEEIVKAATEIQARLDAEAAQAAADAAAQAEADAKAAADAAAAAAQAKADAAAQAEADAKAAADAQAEADAKAAADAAAQAEADAKAAADAAAQAEADAKAGADAAAQAEADAKAAADAAAAAAQAEADTKAAADAAAAQAEADAAKAAADAAAEAEAQAAAEAGAQAEADAAKAAADAAAAQAELPEPAPPSDAEIAAQTEAALAAAAAETAAPDGTLIDPAAGLKVVETPIDPDAPLIEAPVISDTEVEALSVALAAPADPTLEAPAPEVAANAAPVLPPVSPAADVATPVTPDAALAVLQALPASAETVATTVEVIAPEAARTSAQEFNAPPQTVEDGRKTGLSDLERVGLFVLGAVVIGQILNNVTGQNQTNDAAPQGQRVVSNTGDRVVVLNPDGTYGLYKDDDAILRQPGSAVRTETFSDGSSRTIVQRSDGTQVVTVRNAAGRVLRRAQYDRLGRELVLLDDFAPEQAVDIASLPRPRITQSTRNNDAELRAALAARQIAALNRSFSLRQIREISQVRALAAEVDVEKVTFQSGSAAVTPQQANALADLGAVMQEMLAKNPREIFLIEGHTDATGAAAMNLALSDRRAESVALALTEYFDIAPENMVVQGYGETELRIDTQASEAKNRRVAVRIITPLLGSLN